MLESLPGTQGTTGWPGIPPTLGEPLGSHITMPNQNVGCSWNPNVPPLPSCLGSVGGSLGSVSCQVTSLPAPGWFE
jgi:hypothetical protein